jgi:hypothetical protein
MTLTLRHLALLKSWGIDEVLVVDEAADDTETRCGELDPDPQDRLKRSFAHVGEDATMNGFWRWAVRRLSERTSQRTSTDEGITR